jgi:hypothetical protein
LGVPTDEPANEERALPSMAEMIEGQARFHLKAMDDGLKQDMQAALMASVNCYQQRGRI